MTADDVPGELRPLRLPFRRRQGWEWVAQLPADLAQPSDTADEPARSRLRLLESGVAVGPPHTWHSSIAAEGGGLYSHYDGELIFSTTDGSDPNTNGRSYAVQLGPATLKVLGFGSCHLHDALGILRSQGLVYELRYGSMLTGTPRNTLQHIEIHQGQKTPPAWAKRFRVTIPDGFILPRFRGDEDVLVLEFGSSVDIQYGEVLIPTARFTEYLLQPFFALGREEERIARRWSWHGLVGQDDGARQEGVAALLELLPRTELDADFARDVIREVRGSRQDSEASTRTVSDICQIMDAEKICVICAYNAFTPDGRPMSWPANFPRELREVCQRLDLPLLEPSRLVAERGAAFSLQSDLVHFTPGFLEVLADELLDMSESACRRTKSKRTILTDA